MTKEERKEYNAIYFKNNFHKKEDYKIKAELSRKRIKSTIYIITNPAWGKFIKIGRAKDVKSRLASYQTSSPFRDYKLVFFMEVDDVLDAERFIYNKYKMLNEWCCAEWKQVKKDLIKYNKKLLLTQVQ